MAARNTPADELQTSLTRLKRLRRQNAEEYGAWAPPIKAWQAQRLRASYADLAAIGRYQPAVEFFLSDLYGDIDFSGRDASMDRVAPTMIKLLPNAALATVARSIEMDALAEELDQMMALAWRDVDGTTLTAQSYGVLYRSVGCKPMRMRQIALMREVGTSLNLLVKIPAIATTLAAMRIPASLAGVSPLHGFLERGFKAFKHMGDAAEFITTIDHRERRISERLYAGETDPFSLAEDDVPSTSLKTAAKAAVKTAVIKTVARSVVKAATRKK
jgi:hypothetical protein